MDNVTGNIFDVRRFSTHDGDGIRTTVFLKGCPLRCAWCHNPEGISRERRVLYFEKKCMRCQSCIKAAQAGGAQGGANGEIIIDHRRPEDWAKLIRLCPTGALAWDSRTVGVRELYEEILKDEPFFRHGGGVTLSGGEPLLQPQFAAQLLRLLRERGIHTAAETALLVPRENLTTVLPHLDLIFADCKIADDAAHTTATGVSNKIIKDNLRFLLTSDKRHRTIIRTPLIPNFTATDENIAAVAAFLTGIYPEVRYELLNYNPLAAAKYHLVEREYCFAENPARFTKDEMRHFAEVARQAGVKNIFVDE